jgi:glutamate synthase (NADPH) large chain
VFDERLDFAEKRCNLESVELEPILEAQDVHCVKALVARHLELTGSPRAGWILDNWSETLPRFIKVFPNELKRVLGISRNRQRYAPDESVALLVQVERGELGQEHEEMVRHG